MNGASRVEDWFGICELRPDVERTLRRRCPDRHELDDLVQETLMKAARCRSSLQHPSRLRAWVLQIAWNVFRDHVRREHVIESKNATGDELDELQMDAGHGSEADGEGKMECAGELFDVSEMIELVRHLVAELSVPERGLYTAFYTDGLGCASAAELLGTSHKGVKMRLVRLRKKMKRNIRQRATVLAARSARELEAVA